MNAWSALALALTLLRIPLAGLAWWRPGDPAWTLGLAGAAALSDVLDGACARRGGSGRGPRDAGAWLDPLCDKIFVLSVVAALWVSRQPPAWMLPVLATRELLQLALLPLVARRPGYDFRAAPVGKLATVAQFAAVTALLLRPAWAPALVVLAGVLGAGAATRYALRYVASMADARAKLVALLRLAYSGELAAAYAYRGHSASLRDPGERDAIARIEAQEWDHRERVGRMLATLGSGPSRYRELKAWIIGRFLQAYCHVGGWFTPMYGAGRLESFNVGEYVTAARLAREAGRPEFEDDLLDMAEVEWDHEAYFRGKASSHWMWKLFPKWAAPGTREGIRGRMPP